MPEHKIRSGQLLAPFGIGQIVNLPNNVSIMVGGLNLWQRAFSDKAMGGQGVINYNIEEFKIYEPRLSARVAGRKLYKPFVWKKKGNLNKEIPIYGVRFPRWHYCKNSSCRVMTEMSLASADALNCVHCNGQNTMVPVRFVAICPKGHIEDFPFMRWVHRGDANPTIQHILTYEERGGAGDLGSISIRCSCGVTRSLAGITQQNALNRISQNNDNEDVDGTDAGANCQGLKPWTGSNTPEGCDQSLRVVLRGASNVHYSKLLSSIYIPDNQIQKVIADSIINEIGLEELRGCYAQDTNSMMVLKAVLRNNNEVRSGSITIDYILEYIIGLLQPIQQNEDIPITESEFRFQEYSIYVGNNVTEKELITKRITDFSHYIDYDRLNNVLNENFDSIVLLEKMRETISLTGFTRLNPERLNIENKIEQDRRFAMLSDSNVDWLPANVVHGEGLFFQFKYYKIQQWKQSIGETSSFSRVIANYHQYQRDLNHDYIERDLDPVFLMIHTFAHLLIKRLCYNCGYGSSSLKERIYYSNDEATKMCGVLIYTAASDSEGSLGGLVNQGREQFLSKNINEALEDAAWCSADPVCMEVGLSNGQGPGSANGAACHNCAIVSETSCEEFNLLLDRAAVIGTLENPEWGFFRYNM
jgi:hypothetical protein